MSRLSRTRSVTRGGTALLDPGAGSAHRATDPPVYQRWAAFAYVVRMLTLELPGGYGG